MMDMKLDFLKQAKTHNQDTYVCLAMVLLTICFYSQEGHL